ncbi:hypothetical protein FRB94_007336 [Tulasnella sp. JGI-2019a]|nr:hypothetical protein FRB94_007336 [Tulasnella sp. JGI-2019a]
MVARAGAGPPPIPANELSKERLSSAIKEALSPTCFESASRLGEQIRAEDGLQAGVESFYRHLPLERMRCNIDPSRLAIWWSDDLALRVSAFAAQTLIENNRIKLDSLVLSRPKEYDTRKEATDPITGGAAAVLAICTDLTSGLAQLFYKPQKGLINVSTAIPQGE